MVVGFRRVALALVALTVVACSGFSLPGAMSGPRIVEGVFLDRNGAPVPNAEVTLSVSDWVGAIDPGDQVGTIYELRAMTDGAGRFAFHGPPSPEIMAFVAGGDIVNIDLIGIQPGTLDIATWSFPRSLDGSTWVGDAPAVELRVVGS